MNKKNDRVIRLGLMAPLTGLVSLYGEEISRAANIAANEINEMGGLLGKPLEIIIEDDGSLPETAVPSAKKLVLEKKCVSIIGNLLSNSRIAVANQVSEKRKIPYLNFSFYEGSISNRYFFNFAALPNQQINKMIPYMAKKFGFKFFFAGSNYEWPLGSIDAAKSVLKNIGGEVVGEEYLPIGSTNIHNLLDKVKKSGADVFVPYFAGSDQINLLTEFTRIGLKDRMAVVMGHYDEAMVSNMTPDVRDGFYSSNTYFMSIDTIENNKLLTRIQNYPGVTDLWTKGNGILTNFGEGAYVCVKAFANAVEKSGSVDSEDIVEALSTIVVKSAQGLVTMDPMTKHARVNSYLAKCDRNGWFSIIENFGEIDPVIPLRYQNQAELRKVHKAADTHDDISPYFVHDFVAEKILSITDISVIAINESGIIVYVNKNTCDLFQYSYDELVGKNLNILLPPRFHNFHPKNILEFLNEKEIERNMKYRGEIAGYTKKGEEFPAEASISKIVMGEQTLMVASLRDITDRKKMEEKLVWKATHDTLTRLPNRLLIHERISNALMRTLRSENEIAIFFLDIDGFKIINDNYGHEFGDKLLLEVSERLVTVVRQGDTVARFGGDEFIILCEQIENREKALYIVNRLLDSLRKPFFVSENKIFVSGSIGLAFGKGNFHTAEDLIKNADMAMYEAKEKGRDNWRIFSDELQKSMIDELDIANGLRSSVENNNLIPYFQPIYDINGTYVEGAELLTRWVHNNNMISPSIFIPIAEKSGLIIEIGYWVLKEGCLLQKKISEINTSAKIKRHSPFISVNVSTKQLNDKNFIYRVSEILKETSVDPQKIILEITESSLMSNVEKNIDILFSLKNLGLRIAIDDFGTGYSSLNYLSKIPVTKIKIDKSFIDDIVEKSEQKTIVFAIIMMAHAMKLDVIAEGVENVEQLEILKNLGCNQIQGFLFSKPLKSDDFISLFQSGVSS